MNRLQRIARQILAGYYPMPLEEPGHFGVFDSSDPNQVPLLLASSPQGVVYYLSFTQEMTEHQDATEVMRSALRKIFSMKRRTFSVGESNLGEMESVRELMEEGWVVESRRPGLFSIHPDNMLEYLRALDAFEAFQALGELNADGRFSFKDNLQLGNVLNREFSIALVDHIYPLLDRFFNSLEEAGFPGDGNEGVEDFRDAYARGDTSRLMRYDDYINLRIGPERLDYDEEADEPSIPKDQMKALHIVKTIIQDRAGLNLYHSVKSALGEESDMFLTLLAAEYAYFGGEQIWTQNL